MAKATCLIDRCRKPARSRGWCGAHYKRFLKYGDPLAGGPARLNWPENLYRRLRFCPPSTMPTGCIEYTGADSHGYGSINRNGTNTHAHIGWWEEVNGPVPAGHDLHHECENPRCLNPGHLTPKTPKEHRQGHRKDRCRQGHPYTSENTRWNPDGSRRCRACAQAGWVSWRERNLPYAESRRDCVECGAALPAGAPPRRMYCSEQCHGRASYRKRLARGV